MVLVQFFIYLILAVTPLAARGLSHPSPDWEERTLGSGENDTFFAWHIFVKSQVGGRVAEHRLLLDFLWQSIVAKLLQLQAI